jgi:hypothetical protein
MLQIRSNRDVPHSEAEVCLNLWYFVDDTGFVIRLAGKAYALAGSEDEKLAALHATAGTDHLTATQGKVPPNFVLDTEHGEMAGAVPAIDVIPNHGAVFGPLIDKIERELPKSIRSIDDNYKQFSIRIPQDPLCVTTAVYERNDGELIARVGEFQP